MTRIAKTASFLPQNVVTNADLEKTLETSDEWITSRTGIKERHIAERSVSEMAIAVAFDLTAKMNPLELDFIIVATISAELATPSVACLVQGALGAKNAFAFDLNAACSGFVYGLSCANAFLQGSAKRGLVIGVEALSHLVDWTDRKTAVLFGDGAGGVLVEKSLPNQFLAEKLHADGTKGLTLTSGPAGSAQKLAMDGRAIFDFVMHEVKDNLVEVAALADVDLTAVDYFLMHQANQRLLNQLAKKIKVPADKFLSNLAEVGNTSAASIPLLLDAMVKNGTLTLGSGQKIMFSGFGGGLTYGAILAIL